MSTLPSQHLPRAAGCVLELVNATLFGNKGLCFYNQVKTKSCWIKVDPNPRRKFGLRGKENATFSLGKERGVACISQGAKEGPFNRVFKERRPCRHLDFTRLDSRTVREYLSFVLSHPVCGILLTSAPAPPWNLIPPESFRALCISSPGVKLPTSSNSWQVEAKCRSLQTVVPWPAPTERRTATSKLPSLQPEGPAWLISGPQTSISFPFAPASGSGWFPGALS